MFLSLRNNSNDLQSKIDWFLYDTRFWTSVMKELKLNKLKMKTEKITF